MARTDLVTAYLNGATITYRCLGREGGMILNRYVRGFVEYKHENDASWSRERRDPSVAACRVPSDARLAA